MFQYGFIVAADSLAQLLFAPLFGALADKIGAIRPLAITCSIIFIAGTLLYSLLSLVPRSFGSLKQARYVAMLISRFIVGMGLGKCWSSPKINITYSIISFCLYFTYITLKLSYLLVAILATYRLYVSKATYPKERTTHIALLHMFQNIGFLVGPALQAALSPIGEGSGKMPITSGFHFDMYSACG